MKIPRYAYLLLAAGLAIFAFLRQWNGNEDTPQRDVADLSGKKTSENQHSLPPVHQKIHAGGEGKNNRGVNGNSISAEVTSRILEEIHDASVTYHPNGLKVIEPYLLHADPQVRKAAIDGMIVLGERGAASIMRTAAENAPTAQDAVALLEAADYVELPSAKGFMKKKNKQPDEKK